MVATLLFLVAMYCGWGGGCGLWGFNIVVCWCIGPNGFHLSVLNKALASGGGSVVFRGGILVFFLCYPSLPSMGKPTMVVVTVQGPPSS